MRPVVVALCLAFIPVLHATAEEPKTFKPVMVWTGSDSKVADAAFVRCRTDDEWRSTWKKHAGDARCPEVNFDKYEMVAIFQGHSSGGFGISVWDVLEEKDCLRVRFESITPQDFVVPGTDIESRDAKPARKQGCEFAFVLLPRSSRTVLLEEGIRPGLTQPPKWHERATLAAAAAR